MESAAVYLPLGMVIGLALALQWRSLTRGRAPGRGKRGRAGRWKALAAANGWVYEPGHQQEVADSFQYLHHFRNGRRRAGHDVLRGRWRDWPMIVYSHGQSGGGDRGDDYWWTTVVALEIAAPPGFPDLSIGPETRSKRLANLVSNVDIDFESIEFSRAFEVVAADRRFAFDFCDTGMMDHLLRHPDTALELDGPWIVALHRGQSTTETVLPRLERLADVIERIPPGLPQGR